MAHYGSTTNEEPCKLNLDFLLLIPVAHTDNVLLMLLLFLLLQFRLDECSSSYCKHGFQITELKPLVLNVEFILWEILKVAFECL